ncbi:MULTISPECIES: IS4/Tn5 family transposase DNA-binding protein [unclassified Microcoleus]|uniref:IS4/Tn5 family transposase DNA-binding protein n=1 Tax=unclassified Microcoleus TaxID=2642155 RepID=UPI002FCFCEA8
MLSWWEKNFASCELGDERLNNRAYAIGKALSQGFGKALSEIFTSANELKRAYEFLPTAKQNLTE